MEGQSRDQMKSPSDLGENACPFGKSCAGGSGRPLVYISQASLGWLHQGLLPSNPPVLGPPASHTQLLCWSVPPRLPLSCFFKPPGGPPDPRQEDPTTPERCQTASIVYLPIINTISRAVGSYSILRRYWRPIAKTGMLSIPRMIQLMKHTMCLINRAIRELMPSRIVPLPPIPPALSTRPRMPSMVLG